MIQMAIHMAHLLTGAIARQMATGGQQGLETVTTPGAMSIRVHQRFVMGVTMTAMALLTKDLIRFLIRGQAIKSEVTQAPHQAP